MLRNLTSRIARQLQPFGVAAYKLAHKSFERAQVQEDHLWYQSDTCAQLTTMLTEHAPRNSMCGRRCFIIGNGPSLNRTDLSKLKSEVTVGMNKIHLLYDRIDWRPTFLIAINDAVIEQSVSQIAETPSIRLLSARSRSRFADQRGIGFVRKLLPVRFNDRFSRDIRDGWVEGHTVTFAALQVAFYLGCDPVILIGVDHSYSRMQPGREDMRVTATSADPDHFDPRYFDKGMQWDLPNLPMTEWYYRHARRVFENEGRKVLDATVGGHLQVFDKVPYDSLFDHERRV